MTDAQLKRFILRCLREDVGLRDITTELTVPADSRCQAKLVAKGDGVLSGMRPFQMVFDCVEADIETWVSKPDGTKFFAGDVLAQFDGLSRAILTGERTAMNFAQRLSGVASLTARFVEAVKDSDARICDTRKTTPGLRDLEKAAVGHGGGRNHRHALYDGILIKDNHIAAAGGVRKAVEAAKRGAHHLLKIEVEVTDLDECREAIEAGADVILLDNMNLEDMAAAVAMGAKERILFEASGNVTLESVGAIAETGVHIISSGALTHSAPAADLSLRIELA